MEYKATNNETYQAKTFETNYNKDIKDYAYIYDSLKLIPNFNPEHCKTNNIMNRKFYYIEKSGVIIKIAKNCNYKHRLTQILATLDKLPESAFKTIASQKCTIEILDHKYKYETKHNQILMSTNLSNKIYVYDTDFEGPSVSTALIHEIGHIVDKQYTSTRLSKSIEYAKAIKADNKKNGGKCVSKYAYETFVSEDFAESYSFYIKNPKYFKKYFPNRANFIKKVINEQLKNIHPTFISKIINNKKVIKRTDLHIFFQIILAVFLIMFYINSSKTPSSKSYNKKIRNKSF